MITAIRQAIKDLLLHQNSIDPDLVGVHSLCRGGAMALKLHDHSETTIMKQGCWSSLTFLIYIHEQIAHLSKDIASDMNKLVPYVNIAIV
eukprot:9499103-Ditylum_brightwellii.AAC.1